MNWVSKLLEIPLLVVFIFVIMSVIMYFFPPKNINDFYGYRTAKSKKNQETWDFAQRYSAITMTKAGLLLMITSFLGLFVSINENSQVVLGISLTVIAGEVMIYFTEKAIKNKYPNN
jgi:uncharacterized membrane protein